MSTISVKVIEKLRTYKQCGGYRHYKMLDKRKPRVRLFGSGCTGDKPYVMYLCMECAKESTDQKVVKALSEYNPQIHTTTTKGRCYV